jgi:hypothetical protein
MPMLRARCFIAGILAGLGIWGVGTVAAFAEPPNPRGVPLRKAPPRDELVRTLQKGNSSAESRQAAVADLPWSKLSPEVRRLVETVATSAGLYRELPVVATQTDPAIQRFLVERPEVTVAIWRAMEISEFHLTRVQPGRYSADDGRGTVGSGVVLYQDERETLLLCEGTIKSPLLAGTIESRALLHLQTDCARDEAGRPWCRNRVRMFVAFPSATVSAAARLLSPLTNMLLDRNLEEVCLFVAVMDKAMTAHPTWVERTASRLEGVTDADRQALLDVTARVFMEARRRELGIEAGTLSMDDALRTLREAGDQRRDAIRQATHAQPIAP